MSDKVDEAKSLLLRAIRCEGIRSNESKVAFMMVQCNRVMEMLPTIENENNKALSELRDEIEKMMKTEPYYTNSSVWRGAFHNVLKAIDSRRTAG